MALRNPFYLDAEHLISQAEYHDVSVPRAEEIVEKNRSQRRAGAKLGVSGAGVDAGGARDIETQSTYRLEPQQRATVSKIIDGLHRADVIKTNDVLADAAVQKDDLVELEGTVRVTATTLAGKLFYLLREAIKATGGSIDEIDDIKFEDPVVQELVRRIYLDNELLPIPMLLEVCETGLGVKTYVNLIPSHFTDPAAADRIEGERRVLGTVSALVSDGDDGFLSVEQWLLHGWELVLRRLVITDLEDKDVHKLFEGLGLDLPAGSVGTYIKGPALVVDAIALY